MNIPNLVQAFLYGENGRKELVLYLAKFLNWMTVWSNSKAQETININLKWLSSVISKSIQSRKNPLKTQTGRGRVIIHHLQQKIGDWQLHVSLQLMFLQLTFGYSLEVTISKDINKLAKISENIMILVLWQIRWKYLKQNFKMYLFFYMSFLLTDRISRLIIKKLNLLFIKKYTKSSSWSRNSTEKTYFFVLTDLFD